MTQDQPIRRRSPAAQPSNSGSFRLSIRDDRRTPADVRKLGRAFLQITQAQAEAEAAAMHKATQQAVAPDGRSPKEAA